MKSLIFCVKNLLHIIIYLLIEKYTDKNIHLKIHINILRRRIVIKIYGGRICEIHLDEIVLKIPENVHFMKKQIELRENITKCAFKIQHLLFQL